MRVLFIADFFRNQYFGGGESNDDNLINYLIGRGVSVVRKNSQIVTKDDILQFKNVIVGNFVLLSDENRSLLIDKGNYIIYEHDHKYLATRDPSKFFNFEIPPKQVINKNFYESAKCVVVLSKICKQIMESCIPAATVHSIGCSLWSKQTLSHIRSINNIDKKHDYSILKSNNATKNYPKTKQYCIENNILPLEMMTDDYYEFLGMMNSSKTFIFLPTVLETFSRVCAEASMLNTNVKTIKKLIGFYSEDYSHLKGNVLIDKIEDINKNAYEFFYNMLAK